MRLGSCGAPWLDKTSSKRWAAWFQLTPVLVNAPVKRLIEPAAVYLVPLRYCHSVKIPTGAGREKAPSAASGTRITSVAPGPNPVRAARPTFVVFAREAGPAYIPALPSPRVGGVPPRILL